MRHRGWQRGSLSAVRRIVSCCLVTALAASAAHAAGTYVNALYKFEFTPPSGWVLKEHPDALVIFMEPISEHHPQVRRNESDREFIRRLREKLKKPAVLNASFRANITVTTRKDNITTSLDRYARHTRAKAAGLKMYRILDEKRTTLGGQSAVERTVEVTLADGDVVDTRERFCVDRGRLFAIVLSATPQNFAAYSAQFAKVLDSFRWQK